MKLAFMICPTHNIEIPQTLEARCLNDRAIILRFYKNRGFNVNQSIWRGEQYLFVRGIMVAQLLALIM